MRAQDGEWMIMYAGEANGYAAGREGDGMRNKSAGGTTFDRDNPNATVPYVYHEAKLAWLRMHSSRHRVRTVKERDGSADAQHATATRLRARAMHAAVQAANAKKMPIGKHS